MTRRLAFKIILGLSAAATAAAAVSGCTSIAQTLIQEPKVEFSRIGVTDIGVNGATILIGVQVENPNPFTLRVDALKYDLEIGGKPLSSGEIPNAVQVEGRSTKLIDIPVTVKFQDLFSSMMDFLQKTTTTYRVKGEARSGLLKVPFDRTGEMKLR